MFSQGNCVCLFCGNQTVFANAALARGWTDHMEQPIDQNAIEADLRNVPSDVIRVDASEVDRESAGEDSGDSYDDDTSSSSDSSCSEPPLSEVSDQHSMLEHTYQATNGVFKVNRDGTLQGGKATLNLMEIFPPPQWPLARLTLPLKFFVQRLDRLIAGYLMEVVATCSSLPVPKKSQDVCQDPHSSCSCIFGWDHCVIASASPLSPWYDPTW